MKEFILHHPIGLTISNSLKEADVSSLSRSRTDMGTGWVWYALPTIQDEDAIIGIALGFNSGKLEQISLSDTNTKYGAGWENWSKELEVLRAASIAKWLANNGIPPGTYSWGTVWAGYDAKGGFGSAVVGLAT